MVSISLEKNGRLTGTEIVAAAEMVIRLHSLLLAHLIFNLPSLSSLGAV